MRYIHLVYVTFNNHLQKIYDFIDDIFTSVPQRPPPTNFAVVATFFIIITYILGTNNALITIRPKFSVNEFACLATNSCDQDGQDFITIKTINPRSGNDLITKLKENDLWNITTDSDISPVLFTNFPAEMNKLDMEIKKKAFLNTLFSVSIIAMSEVEKEREQLRSILAKIDDCGNNFIFSEKYPEWKEYLAPQEIFFVNSLSMKYRTNSAKELINRVDIVPVSLVLAQGAFESSWGTSRFAKQGNNLFGLWTWAEQGIIPTRREQDKNHRIETYGSILDSIRTYILTLNRLPAYKEFRQIRKRSMNPMDLAEGLRYYSERGNAYIEDIKTLIDYNNLTEYDRLVNRNSRLKVTAEIDISRIPPDHILTI